MGFSKNVIAYPAAAW